MLARGFVTAFVVAALLGASAAAALAQVGQISGHVWMQRADGQKAPVAGALIDVYRTDVKGATFSTKTNDQGEFVVGGVPIIGTYTIAASHPTAAAGFVRGIRGGREAEIIVTAGNGQRLSLEAIETAAATLAKSNAAIEAANKKITETNEAIASAFRAGNDALSAANTASRSNNPNQAILKFTEAIARYDEGLAVDRKQAAILTNKAVALKGRAVERYNPTVTSRTLTAAAKSAALDAAKADFKAAVDASTQAVDVVKAQPAAATPDDAKRDSGNRYAALLTRAESMRLFVKIVDSSQAAAGLTAFKEYIAVETDPVMKGKAQLDVAQMLLDAGEADKALAEFRIVLAMQPDNPDANLGAGMSIYASGNKARFQDAANYLQHFVDVAPSHPRKDEARFVLEDLKSTEKIVPKTTPRVVPGRP